MHKKKQVIHKMIDFLIDLKFEDSSFIRVDQVDHLRRISEMVDLIDDDASLDSIIKSLVQTVNTLSASSNLLYQNITKEGNIFMEKLDRYNETKKLEELFNDL